jgi:hypothetical protein
MDLYNFSRLVLKCRINEYIYKHIKDVQNHPMRYGHKKCSHTRVLELNVQVHYYLVILINSIIQILHTLRPFS